jgi:hypothetical protein
LSGISFSWFSALAPGSILTWTHLEQRFHDHFYSGENELKLSHLTSGSILTWTHLEQRFHDHFYSGENKLKLSHLTSIKQQHDESVVDYIKRFRDKKSKF